MFDLGMAKLHVGDLSPHWQDVAKNLNPAVQLVWVVFFEGQIFGVYLTAIAAAKAIEKIEAALAANKRPQPQSPALVKLLRIKKDAALKSPSPNGEK